MESLIDIQVDCTTEAPTAYQDFNQQGGLEVFLLNRNNEGVGPLPGLKRYFQPRLSRYTG